MEYLLNAIVCYCELEVMREGVRVRIDLLFTIVEMYFKATRHDRVL